MSTELDNNFMYHAPTPEKVRQYEEIRATAAVPQNSNFEDFHRTLGEHEQARITLVSTIMSGSQIAAEFEGTYAAKRKPQAVV